MKMDKTLLRNLRKFALGCREEFQGSAQVVKVASAREDGPVRLLLLQTGLQCQFNLPLVCHLLRCTFGKMGVSNE